MTEDSIQESTNTSQKTGKMFTSKTQAPLLTSKEMKMLNTIARGGVAFCCRELLIERNYAYQRLYKIRKKIKKAQHFLNVINRYKRDSPILRKLLITVDDDRFETRT
jgi:hypothetical protein